MTADGDEGYVLVATGSRRYLDLALSCCHSIRFFDSRRPIQLIVSEDLLGYTNSFGEFDFLDGIDHDPQLGATLNKLRIFDISRFIKSMYIDADCLLMKPDIDRQWMALNDYSFAIPGQKTSSGLWYGTDVRKLCDDLQLGHIVKINSGVIYFKKDERAHDVFAHAKAAYCLHNKKIMMTHSSGQHGDEPFFAISMSQCGLPIFPPIADDKSSLMFSTIDSDNFDMNVLKGRCSFTKGGIKVSPHIAHFVGLRPVSLYNMLRDEFARLFEDRRTF